MKLFRKQDKEEKNIGHLNLASRYGLVKPGYRQDLSSRVLEFAYLPDDERVVLLGSMDGSYPYWISETDIGDIETNTAVVESILRKDFSSFTGMTGERPCRKAAHKMHEKWYTEDAEEGRGTVCHHECAS